MLAARNPRSLAAAHWSVDVYSTGRNQQINIRIILPSQTAYILNITVLYILRRWH
jgi:hypothetical protein